MEPVIADRLDGQVALVTGANRGLGAATAAGIADLGATVYGGARDPADVDDELRAVELDVTDDAGVERAIERIEDEAGRLDVLVNNAGVNTGRDLTLVETPLEVVDEVLAVNLRGPIAVTKHALPLLTERSGSRVVNVSSGMGGFDAGMGENAPAYRVSKAGLNGLTVYLDAEHGPELIANSVTPGWVRTDMGGPDAERSIEEGADTIVWLSRFEPGSPGGAFWMDRSVIEW